MDSTFLNKAAFAALLSFGAVFLSWAVAQGVIPHTEPLRPTFSVPDTEKIAIASYMAKANAIRGADLAQQICSSCHAFVEGASDGVGPNLSGVSGRHIASAKGYAYSAALSGQNTHIWSDQALSDWLSSPARFAAGTKMSLVGLSSPAQRADIIAYLHSLGDSGLPSSVSSQQGPL